MSSIRNPKVKPKIEEMSPAVKDLISSMKGLSKISEQNIRKICKFNPSYKGDKYLNGHALQAHVLYIKLCMIADISGVVDNFDIRLINELCNGYMCKSSRHNVLSALKEAGLIEYKKIQRGLYRIRLIDNDFSPEGAQKESSYLNLGTTIFNDNYLFNINSHALRTLNGFELKLLLCIMYYAGLCPDQQTYNVSLETLQERTNAKSAEILLKNLQRCLDVASTTYFNGNEKQYRYTANASYITDIFTTRVLKKIDVRNTMIKIPTDNFMLRPKQTSYEGCSTSAKYKVESILRRYNAKVINKQSRNTGEYGIRTLSNQLVAAFISTVQKHKTDFEVFLKNFEKIVASKTDRIFNLSSIGIGQAYDMGADIYFQKIIYACTG